MRGSSPATDPAGGVPGYEPAAARTKGTRTHNSTERHERTKTHGRQRLRVPGSSRERSQTHRRTVAASEILRKAPARFRADARAVRSGTEAGKNPGGGSGGNLHKVS